MTHHTPSLTESILHGHILERACPRCLTVRHLRVTHRRPGGPPRRDTRPDGRAGAGRVVATPGYSDPHEPGSAGETDSQPESAPRWAARPRSARAPGGDHRLRAPPRGAP